VKEVETMLRCAWIVLVLLAGTAQGALSAEALNDQQKLGWRLFETSCGVCHTRPTLVARLFGPELSKQTAGGREDVIRDTIANGTPRMPGFKVTYSPEQIAAIAAYVMTLEPGNQNLPTAPR
jgi:mono/diheme cytochrome c family protein